MSDGSVDAFLAYLADDRNRSPHTVRAYAAHLHRIPGGARHATPDTIQAWWETLYGLAPASRAQALSAARSYYRWAQRQGHRGDDPTLRLDAPTVHNAMPRMIGRDQVADLLGPDSTLEPTVRRGLALGLYGGLRIHEAAKADWADADLDTRRLYVRGKGGKERVIALDVRLLDHLMPATGGNIAAAGRRAWSTDRLGRACNAAIATVAPGNSFHDLRKRGASLALAAGLSMPLVQRYYGWASLATVAHYAVVDDEELARVAAAIT